MKPKAPAKKRRPGRRPMPADQRRSTKIEMFLTAADKEAIGRAADAASVSLSDFARAATLAAAAPAAAKAKSAEAKNREVRAKLRERGLM